MKPSLSNFECNQRKIFAHLCIELSGMNLVSWFYASHTCCLHSNIDSCVLRRFNMFFEIEILFSRFFSALSVSNFLLATGWKPIKCSQSIRCICRTLTGLSINWVLRAQWVCTPSIWTSNIYSVLVKALTDYSPLKAYSKSEFHEMIRKKMPKCVWVRLCLFAEIVEKINWKMRPKISNVIFFLLFFIVF